ncbi:MAG: mevalonate kinase [Acidilobus sp.]|nr:mevalonate kinase [Acidilobus sp.]MCG2889773.1 mevalonate kinase [Acidilobus sp.]MCG2891113.1 mevalonate kinase [Acidilobus sp.]
MRYSRARAPAKVILFGEHFVVNGSRAIATALDLFTSVTAAEKASWPLELESASLGLKCVTGPELTCSSRELEPLLSTIRALRSRGYDVPPARLTVESDIPPSAGLGSSASVSAATAAALTALAGQDIGPEELFEVTMEGERVAHGNPSGVDPATVVYGGTIVFRRGQGVLERLEGGLSVPLVVADSGLRRSTAAPVLNVLRFLDRVGPLRGSLLGLVEQLIDLAWSAIRGNQLEDVGALMNINHGLLSAIGVSTPELEELVYAARRAGALGSKLTGAGWGGSIIALPGPGSVEAVLEALRSRSGWVRALGSGVRGAHVIEVSP